MGVLVVIVLVLFVLVVTGVKQSQLLALGRRLEFDNNNNNPHQNLSEGGVLEVCNLTHKLLRGFWLILGDQGSDGPMSQEEQEQQLKNF